jgi:ribonuclease R
MRAHDPHIERERAKYENPIPSRELILDLLNEVGVPMHPDDIALKLEIADTEQDGFIRRINAMERDGQVMRNRKGDICLIGKLDLITGKVQGHPDGFGFLVPDDGSADLFLGPKQMHRVLHGDRAVVREIGLDRKGRREASIVEVLEHANSKVVGRLFVEHGVFFVIAENKRISQDILVEPGYDKGAKAGQVVVVELVAQPSKNAEPVARVLEILGNYADPGMEIEIALRKHDLPHEWPAEIEALEKKIPKKVTAKDMQGREDLRKLPFVTIDGETARDFDDAVYCEKQAGGKNAGFRLLVAIADVSHYVKTGDALDRESRLRGNSVYFPRRVIPMLPEALSNEMCSLKPAVDRLALVCEMQISPMGEVKQYKFMEAVFHSAARLTYTNVAKALYTTETDHGIDAKLMPHLNMLNAVFQTLLAARNKRGAIDFEGNETMMIFDEGCKIERIVKTVRNDAHRLIEECMLAANVCAANYLVDHEHVTLFRVHEGPSEEKLVALRAMLKDFGLQLMGAKKPKPSDYADVLAKIKPRPDAPLLQTVMLRSMKQAVYSPDNQGHFGLAYEAYAHFTSPIRRYPDLLTHRAIKAVLRGETYDPKASWEELGMQCSATERRADEATRDVNAWLKCFYMKDRVGDEFVGTISGVTSFGIFVTLDEVYVEGLVHISELGKDYFHFDQDKHMILGERTRKKYQLADRVNIKVVRVDIETSKIDFALAGDAPKLFVPMEKVETPLPAGVVRPTQPTVVPIAVSSKKGKKTPSAEPVAVAPKQKTVTTVTSANPPTTPLAGFTSGKEKTVVKVRAPAFKPTLEPAPKPKTKPKTKQGKKAKPTPGTFISTAKNAQGKTKSSGALLNKKVGSKVAVNKTKSKKK